MNTALHNSHTKYTVGKGWHPLVDEATERLNSIGVKVLSHFEKYGTLQFNVEPEPLEAIIILNEIEDRSHQTCEMCGATGSEVSEVEFKGWVKTLCPTCQKLREQQHTEYLRAKDLKYGMRVKISQLRYIYEVYILLSNIETNTCYDEITGIVEFVGKQITHEISASSMENDWLCYIKGFDEREAFDLEELDRIDKCSEL